MNLIPRDQLFGNGLLDLDKVFESFFTPNQGRAVDNLLMTPRVDIRDLQDHYEYCSRITRRRQGGHHCQG